MSKRSKKAKRRKLRVGVSGSPQFAKKASISQAAKEAMSIPFVREISRTDQALSKRLVRAYILGTNTAGN